MTSEDDLLSKTSNDVINNPQSLDDYIGQKEIIETLKVSVLAAKQRNECLGHILLVGPRELDRKSLVVALANEMEVHIKFGNFSDIKKEGDLAALMSTLEAGDILFIENCDSITKEIEKLICPAMEDFCLDIALKDGTAVKTIRLPLPPFTMAASVTNIQVLSDRLYNCFDIICKMEFYEVEDLVKLIHQRCSLLNTVIDPAAAETIAVISHGTPRNAYRLLNRIRDFAQVYNYNVITTQLVENTLNSIRIEDYY